MSDENRIVLYTCKPERRSSQVVRVTREPNKVEIKKHLKAGDIVPGAELETRMNLQIK